MAITYRVLFNKVEGFMSMAAVFVIGCIVVGCIVMAGTGQGIGTRGSSDTGTGNSSVSREVRIELGGRQTAGTEDYGPLLGVLLTERDTQGDYHTVLSESRTVRVRSESLVGVAESEQVLQDILGAGSVVTHRIVERGRRVREAFITPLLISSRYLLASILTGNKTGNVGAVNGSWLGGADVRPLGQGQGLVELPGNQTGAVDRRMGSGKVNGY